MNLRYSPSRLALCAVLACAGYGVSACGSAEGGSASTTDTPLATTNAHPPTPTTGIAPDPSAARLAPPDVVAPDAKDAPIAATTSETPEKLTSAPATVHPDACVGSAFACGSPVYATPPYPINWTPTAANLMGVNGPCTRDHDCEDGLTCNGGACEGPNPSNVGYMEVDPKEDGVSGGPGWADQAVGVLVTSPVNYTVNLVVMPHYGVEWTSYVGADWPSSHTTSGDVAIYVQDTTSGAVVVNQPTYFWNLSEQGFSSQSNTSPGFSRPCAYDGNCSVGTPWRYLTTQPTATFAMTPGHTYAVWVEATAVANYDSSDVEQMFVQVNSIEYYWQPT